MWTSSFWLMTLFWSINVLVFFPNYVINYMMKRIRMNVLILTFTFLCISAWKNHLVVQIQVWWYCHSFCRIVSHKILMAGCCIVSAEPSCQARRIVAFSHFEIGWLVLCPWKTQTNNSWTNWNNVDYQHSSQNLWSLVDQRNEMSSLTDTLWFRHGQKHLSCQHQTHQKGSEWCCTL